MKQLWALLSLIFAASCATPFDSNAPTDPFATLQVDFTT